MVQLRQPLRPLEVRDAAFFGFVLALAVLLIGGGLGFRNLERLADSRRMVDHTYEVIGGLDTLLSTIKDAETGQRGYLLAENKNYLQPYEDAAERVQAEVAHLKELTAGDPDQQARFAALEPKIDAKLAELKKTVALMDKGDRPAALKIVRGDTGKEFMNEVRKGAAAMQQVEHDRLRQRAEESEAQHRVTIVSILLTAVMGVLLVGVVFYLSERHIRQRHRAAVIISEQKERLRTTLASIGDAVISTNVEGHITNMNAVAESLTGWKNDQAAGQPLDVVFRIVNESTRQPVANPAARALKEGIIVGLANHTVLIAKDGTERPIDDSAAPIRCKDGEVVGCVLVFRDVSQRRQSELAEVERRRLAELRADAVIALAETEETRAALQRCTEALVSHLDMAFARIWTLNEAENVLELQASAGLYTHLDGPHSRVKVGDFKIGRIAGNRQPHLTNAVPDDPNVSDRDWAKREGMVAFAGYPLLAEGRVVGVMAMFARRPLTDAVLTDLAPLAGNIGEYLHRRRTEAAFHESEARKAAVVSSALDGIITIDHVGKIIEFNPAAERTFGYRRDQVLGREMAELIIPPALRESYRTGMAQYLATGVGPILGQRLELTAMRADGTEFPVEVAITRINADGPLLFTGYVRDITDRKQAEERFRAMADNIPQLAWMARPDGHTYWYNRRWYEYTGTTPDTQEGWGWESIHDPDVLPKVLERWKQSIATGDPFDMVFPLKGKDGVFRPFLTRIMPVKDANGRVMQWFGTNTDITEQQTLQLAVRESERRLRFVMDSAPQKIFTAAPNGDIDYFNPIWMEFTGLSFEQIKGWGWKRFIHPDDVAENIRLWQHSIDTGEPIQFEHRFRRADGEYRWHLTRAQAMRDADGKVVMWIGSNTDIHEQKQTAEHLRKLASELSEAGRRKDEFLATLAHELRNPLAPIRNGLQIMRLASGNGTEIEHARAMMERQVAQMVRLVDDLLDTSRISRGAIDLRKERIDLAAVVSNAIETSRPVIEEMGHELSVELPEQPVLIEADLTRLAQVFSNLLTNAAKYSDRGGHIRLTAVVRNQESGIAGQEVEVSVRDTGVGIPPDMLPRIFDMFTQVDRSLERSQGGLGIGLTLVKRLVEMHCGSVEARSDGPGRGSEFIVRLPVTAAMARDAEPPTTNGDAAAPPARRRILVADDNTDSAASLGMMLEMMGHAVRTANDGSQAVDMAATFQPDVILLDIGMPQLNGYEACRRIREQPWGENAVLIALTGWGQDGDKQRSREAGFDHHLVKPVDPAALERLLAEARAPAG